MIRAVIFDYDGTISDTLPCIAKALNRTMRELGFPEYTTDEVCSFVSFGARELIRCALPARLRADEAEIDRVLARYEQNCQEVYRQAPVLYDGILLLLASLHKHVRIGVLSNKEDPILRRLCRQQLPANCIDAVQGVTEDCETKPDPVLTKKLTDALGVPPSDCVLVGDSDVDVATAKNAGMLHVGVTWGFRSRQALLAAGATRLADTPAALEELLLSLCAPSPSQASGTEER